jgi:malate dehydrogenase
MDLAIIGAAGACGRQLAAQILALDVLDPSARLQLVGHHDGASHHELWGLRADLHDAFADRSPSIQLVDEPDRVDADVVVMLAGATVPTDPHAVPDRARLAAVNEQIFSSYADALARRSGTPPVVIVQSNPVEHGVEVFAAALGRHRVVGAGAWSDTLRFRREVAHELGVRRPQVDAMVLGQHGDHLVPVWSRLEVVGVDAGTTARFVATQRGARRLADLASEIGAAKLAMLELVRADDVAGAYASVEALPVDVRTGVKPFFTHFTAGHTTEIHTAHAVADLVATIVGGSDRRLPLQVALEGEVAGLRGVTAVPVVLGPTGWCDAADPGLADDEREALGQAVLAASVRSPR